MKSFESSERMQLQGMNSDAVKRNGEAVELQPGMLCVDYLIGIRSCKYYSKVTDHGQCFEFEFKYVDLGRYWEIDIVKLPNYRGRNTSAYIIHTLPSNRGGKKICVATGHEPRTERDAKKLSMSWADLQAEYIKTGVTPDEQIRRNH